MALDLPLLPLHLTLSNLDVMCAISLPSRHVYGDVRGRPCIISLRSLTYKRMGKPETIFAMDDYN